MHSIVGNTNIPGNLTTCRRGCVYDIELYADMLNAKIYKMTQDMDFYI